MVGIATTEHVSFGGLSCRLLCHFVYFSLPPSFPPPSSLHLFVTSLIALSFMYLCSCLLSFPLFLHLHLLLPSFLLHPLFFFAPPRFVLTICLSVSLSLPGAATLLQFFKWWGMRYAVPMTWKLKVKRKRKARKWGEIQLKPIRLECYKNSIHLLYFCLFLLSLFSLCLPWANYSMPFPPIALIKAIVQIKILREVVFTATKGLD